jgi:hypothetical protein
MDIIFPAKRPQLESGSATLYFQWFSLFKMTIFMLFWTAMMTDEFSVLTAVHAAITLLNC